MKLKQSPALIIWTTVLSLLSACSRTSGTSPSSQTGGSTLTTRSLATPQLPQKTAELGSSQSSGDLDCPVALRQEAGATFEETPKQIAIMGRQLGVGGENQISAAVTQLHSRHPKASEGEIVNYLITVFCPTIKRKSHISLKEKQQVLRTFATKARKLASRA